MRLVAPVPSLDVAIALTLVAGAVACRPPVPTSAPTGSVTALAATPKEAASAPTTGTAEASDLAAARALFEKNIRAIQDKDRDAYLSCYRPDERLVRSGEGGPALGFEDLATGTSTDPATWPTRLEATELTVHPLAPGVVYGSYRYEVEFDGTVRTGWSERVFVRTKDGFHIALSTAFDD